MTAPEQLAETVRKALGKTNFHGLHDEAEAALSSLLAALEEMRQERDEWKVRTRQAREEVDALELPRYAEWAHDEDSIPASNPDD